MSRLNIGIADLSARAKFAAIGVTAWSKGLQGNDMECLGDVLRGKPLPEGINWSPRIVNFVKKDLVPVLYNVIRGLRCVSDC